MSNVVSYTRLQFRFSWNLISCCVSRRHGQRSNVLAVFISLSGSNMRPCFAFARRNTRAMVKKRSLIGRFGFGAKGFLVPSSDVSSRFFWVERCVTAQKTAARETTLCMTTLSILWPCLGQRTKHTHYVIGWDCLKLYILMLMLNNDPLKEQQTSQISDYLILKKKITTIQLQVQPYPV